MSWEQFARVRWRSAIKIHSSLQALRTSRQQIDLPTASWSFLHDKILLLANAQRLGWSTSVAELNHESARCLSELMQRLQQVQQTFRQRLETPPLLMVSQIWLELEALTEEFIEVDVDLLAHEIRVTTDAIELEGIDLGRFQIILDWTHLSQRQPYRIVALDPAPAESKEDLFHPHVNDDSLCEGDGQLAIRNALAQGRLLDFFMLVRQVLSTYNPDSAYLSLDQWYGLPCQDCGQISHEDDLGRCRGCDDLICSDCSGSCHSCYDSCCQSCQRLCPQCENYFCPACLIGCSACGASGCDSCLADGLCPDCQPPEEELDAPVESKASETLPETEPALHPVCLGEAALSA